MKNPLVINIQKCSIHDGPGIRNTVFFKGCPLECIWCHNPESQVYTKEVLYNEEKCNSCKACENKCPENAIYENNGKICLNKEECKHCETCLDYCIKNAREIVGTEYSVRELVKELEKDMLFYEESNGGVTLSGGEVMTQNIDYITQVINLLNEKGIHIAIDTCGYANPSNFEKIADKVDLFLYDIKLIDDDKHIRYTGKSNELILNNLKLLSQRNANINIRIPLIENINVDDKNIEINKIIDFLNSINIRKVSLLPYHNIGMYKYKKLDKEYEGIELKRPYDEKLEEIKDLFEQNNFDTKIGG